jgi:phosphoribosylamine---glycine ligase
MRILVVGGGGREHALVWKIAQSPLIEKIYCAPGNAGIAQQAECVALLPTDLDGLADFAEAHAIDLTVVGPEVPLIAGIVDRFEARGLRIFGPSPDPARLEGSKIFAKRLMQDAGIPTAAFAVCESEAEALAYLNTFYSSRDHQTKIVIKADGVAAGKGVTVANTAEEARAAVKRMMEDRIFGASGDRVVIEECLVGEEASIMAITDGRTVLPLLPAQDHKRVFDEDQGANTGGMGAYAPVPILPPDVVVQTVEKILTPAIAAIRNFGIPYRGVLYAGIMVTPQGIKTIEFNCRFGDPETQTVLPLLESDLVPLLLASIDGTLDEQTAKWRNASSVCVVAASGGYPDAFEKGKPISGLEQAASERDCLVFHSGTSAHHDQVLTDGGRVLSVTGLGATLLDAAAAAYNGMGHLEFDGIHYRRDIAAHSLRVP